MRSIIILLTIFFISYNWYNYTKISIIHGKSMLPYFPEEGVIEYYPNHIPHIGDSISFKCNVDKCHNKTLHKFLKKKNGDCIWVEGGNEMSFDSRSYGWLCGNEYKILGVVKT